MVEVIVERTFETPVELAEVQSLEDRGAWCLQTHHVRFLRTWFARDRRRMICLYEAPDAESVRIAQRDAGMPVDRVWTGTRNPVPADWPGPGPGPQEHVVVERTFDDPITPDRIARLFAAGGECMPRHKVAYEGGFYALNGHRMMCVFIAPDAESVRIVNRQSGAPFVRAWTATVHEAAPGLPG